MRVSDLSDQMISENRGLKGALVKAEGLGEEEKGKTEDGDEADMKKLRGSSVLKCEADYLSMMGDSRGHLLVSPCFLIFEPGVAVCSVGANLSRTLGSSSATSMWGT